MFRLLQSLWGGRKASEPEVILLRGQKRRSDPGQMPLLEALPPTPFALDVGEAHRERLNAPETPIRRAWHERGFELPAFLCSESLQLKVQEVSLSLYGVEQRRIEIPNTPALPYGVNWSPAVDGLLPLEVIQLEIARMLAESSQRLLTRDGVRNLALVSGIELPPEQLSRLSKYFRGCWKAGWSLPPTDRWPELAACAPFDEIGAGHQSACERPPLAFPKRWNLLLSLVPSECRAVFGHIEPAPHSFAHIQAVEEFCVAARAVRRSAGRQAVPIVRALLLEDKIALFKERCRQNPTEMLELLEATKQVPAPTYPAFQKLAMLLTSLGSEEKAARKWLEEWLGPLPPLLATSEQVERVLNDYTL